MKIVIIPFILKLCAKVHVTSANKTN